MRDDFLTTFAKISADDCIQAIRGGWKADLESQLKTKGCYLWGKGRLSVFAKENLTSQGIEILGFLDNAYPAGKESENIVPISSISHEDIIIICCDAYPSVFRQLHRLGCAKIIYYEELQYHIPDIGVFNVAAYKGIIEEIESHKGDYIRLYQALADEMSREIFRDVIQFRLAFDAERTIHAHSISVSDGTLPDFDCILTRNFNENTVFLDVGGFDGETTCDFVTCTNGNYGHVYLFEPDKDAFLLARKKLENVKDITFINAGAGKSDGVARFDPIGGDRGKLSDNGSIEVQIESLDKYVKSSNTYVKMDIEGAEADALKGMESSIRRFAPYLGISMYHILGDLHKLFDQIMNYHSEYDVYLRHYKDTIADTLCYFIPK